MSSWLGVVVVVMVSMTCEQWSSRALAVRARAELRRFRPVVDVGFAGFDQAVGVDGDHASFGQLHLGGLEGAHPQTDRCSRGKVGEGDATTGIDDRGRRVAGAGDGTSPGDRVVDDVKARGAHDPAGEVVRAGLLLGQAYDEVVEAGEYVLGRQIHGRERVNSRTKPPHRRGGGDAVPDDISDDQCDARPWQRNDVEPVAADAAHIHRQVVRGHLEGTHVREVGEGDVALPGKVAGLPARLCGNHGDLFSRPWKEVLHALVRCLIRIHGREFRPLESRTSRPPARLLADPTLGWAFAPVGIDMTTVPRR